VLHRDIKPANCFTDRDATVKIGDFGLSISTLGRDVTQLTRLGAFRGTPQFASPEQIRGDALDVRADIYSVGATLYYLLTGQPPFEDQDLMALLTRIATDSPRVITASVPRELAAITLGCLAKDRASRPATYAALTDALRPFGSGAPRPAPLGRRVLANIIDRVILTLSVLLAAAGAVSLGVQRWSGALALAAAVVYYGASEGYGGASIGKRLCRLRVTGRDAQRPGLARALLRALIFELAASPLALSLGQASLAHLIGHARLSTVLWIVSSYVVLRGLLFSTVRRRNGLAGVHDLVSGTRVIERVRDSPRPVLDDTVTTPVARTSAQRIGPYDVVGTLGATDIGVLLVGFDPALRRRVWVHALTTSVPPITPLVRDISRPGRLRWLSGRRTKSENWDAYEALDGAPFASAVAQAQSWHRVKHWLLDLSREIDSGLRDGSLPMLTLNRIWISRDGHARLLDFSAPGTPPSAPAASSVTFATAQEFLSVVATRALDGHGSPMAERSGSPRHPVLPLSASAWLRTLSTQGFASSQDLVAQIAARMSGPDTVARWRRTASIVPCVVGPAILAVIAALSLTLAQRAVAPDVAALSTSLRELASLPEPRDSDAARRRTALEVYIAGHFGALIADEKDWHSPIVTLSMGRFRRLAERVLADHPHVTPDELTAAVSVLGPFVQSQERAMRGPTRTLVLFVALVEFLLLLAITASVGLLAALFLRGGILMRVLGIAVVTRTGQEASRCRVFGRALVAWLPLIALLVMLVGSGVLLSNGFSNGWQRHPMAIAAVAVLGVLFLGGAVWAALHPERGLQDRIAGTSLVPT
jgi:uncharacterized RDD family membrane protein YckC